VPELRQLHGLQLKLHVFTSRRARMTAARYRKRSSILLASVLVALAGCQKKDDLPKAAPTVTAPPPAVSIAPIKEPEAEASAAASGAGGAATPPAESAPSTVAEGTAKKPVAGGSVQACCTALAEAAKKSSKPKEQQRYGSAASVCAGLEKALKSGRANLAATKVTLRAQLAGVPVPGGC
jgi:hypothetical protein